MKLVITYEEDYSTTPHTALKTVRFPLRSTTAGDSGTKRSNCAAAATCSFAYLLDLPDRALAEQMHKLEERSDEDAAPFVHFQRKRTELSRDAWQALTNELGCDQGPIADAGVMVFPLDKDLARRLLRALLASPRVKMRRKDFALGYVSTSAAQCDYLNSSNHYHALSPTSLALLSEFLSTAGPMI